uniref:Uncharacterized protein n=1 Tax=Rhizophora mucronata TaxID=61149 RepID=A0A2P2R4D4_RHIMU
MRWKWEVKCGQCCCYVQIKVYVVLLGLKVAMPLVSHCNSQFVYSNCLAWFFLLRKANGI